MKWEMCWLLWLLVTPLSVSLSGGVSVWRSCLWPQCYLFPGQVWSNVRGECWYRWTCPLFVTDIQMGFFFWFLFVFFQRPGSQDAAQDDFSSEHCWTLNVWKYRSQERPNLRDTHKFTCTTCHPRMHTRTHTCFDKSKPKPAKFSLPCRVIMSSTTIYTQWEYKRAEQPIDKDTSKLPDHFLFFPFKPEGASFTRATFRWIGVSHLRARECRSRFRSDYDDENPGRCVSLTGLTLLFREWCLHKTAWTLQRLNLEKDRRTLQRPCVQTLKGHGTLRLKHWTHRTDLSEDKLTEGKDTLI